MSASRERWWHRYIPTNFANPFGLGYRLLTSENPAARSAVAMAAAGLLLTPVDVLLQSSEKKTYSGAGKPRKSVLIVCGPPRSGTTLIAQFLINALDAAYLNNLTSLFPRSPITANRWFGRFAPLEQGSFSAYYGKSRGLSGANDALYIWDRWLGPDRRVVPDSLTPGSADAIRTFFGALETHYGLPIVAKANRLNTCAHLVAEQLETSRFLCLQRDPLMLAQSLYLARSEIVGDMTKAYGVQHPDANESDPVDDVCRQVLFHENHAKRQQQLIGEQRFSIVSYEDFCSRPAALAEAVVRDSGDLSFREDGPVEDQALQVSTKRRLPEDVLDRMQTRLHELGSGKVNCRRF